MLLEEAMTAPRVGGSSVTARALAPRRWTAAQPLSRPELITIDDGSTDAATSCRMSRRAAGRGAPGRAAHALLNRGSACGAARRAACRDDQRCLSACAPGGLDAHPEISVPAGAGDRRGEALEVHAAGGRRRHPPR
jgi:hypothetical protein